MGPGAACTREHSYLHQTLPLTLRMRARTIELASTFKFAFKLVHVTATCRWNRCASPGRHVWREQLTWEAARGPGSTGGRMKVPARV